MCKQYFILKEEKVEFIYNFLILSDPNCLNTAPGHYSFDSQSVKVPPHGGVGVALLFSTGEPTI